MKTYEGCVCFGSMFSHYERIKQSRSVQLSMHAICLQIGILINNPLVTMTMFDHAWQPYITLKRPQVQYTTYHCNLPQCLCLLQADSKFHLQSVSSQLIFLTDEDLHSEVIQINCQILLKLLSATVSALEKHRGVVRHIISWTPQPLTQPLTVNQKRIFS